MEINLRWNVAPSSFLCEATRLGEEKAPTQKIPPPKRPLLQREASGCCKCFLKVFGSLLRLGPKSGGKYCRDQQESGVASLPAWMRFCFQCRTASPGRLAFLTPPEVLGPRGEHEVKNILGEILPCCVIREWCGMLCRGRSGVCFAIFRWQ